LQNWTNVETPEIVVQYRSPRISHFLSIWKQTTQVKKAFPARSGCVPTIYYDQQLLNRLRKFASGDTKKRESNKLSCQGRGAMVICMIPVRQD
jgi:hypothetical protein